jgi:hypothetical protein
MKDIKDGIIKRLDEFRPNIPKYDEQIKQGFDEPAFFVLQIDGAQQKEIDRKYKRSAMYDIHYFPDSRGLTEKSDCQSMAELLYGELEYIQGEGGKYRGLRMKHEVVADVLHFFISFDVRLIKSKAIDPKMQTLEQEEHLK